MDNLRLTLIPVAGKHRGEEFVIERFPRTIGRSPTCKLILSNPRVSRVHCTLTTRDRRVFVADESSSNGTFVNGRRIDSETPLEDGDRLAVGPVEFWVRIGPDSVDSEINVGMLLADL